jgi:hypothetical protein
LGIEIKLNENKKTVPQLLGKRLSLFIQNH